MKEALKKQIEEVLPELENALVKAGDIVVVNGVSIERFEAEKICVELKEELKSKIKKCKIDWDLIPLELVFTYFVFLIYLFSIIFPLISKL